jgi:hypothetical protein
VCGQDKFYGKYICFETDYNLNRLVMWSWSTPKHAFPGELLLKDIFHVEICDFVNRLALIAGG